MINTLGTLFPLLSFVLPLLALNVYFIRETYKHNIAILHAHENAIRIQPKRSRFILSSSILYLGTPILIFAVSWLLPINKSMLIFFMVYLLPIFWVINLFLSYPQYTLTIDNAKLSGAPLWDWKSSRVEIDINEIDEQKVLQQNLGRSLGIVVFKSANGTKILALGLDSLQIQKILDYANVNVH